MTLMNHLDNVKTERSCKKKKRNIFVIQEIASAL